MEDIKKVDELLNENQEWIDELLLGPDDEGYMAAGALVLLQKLNELGCCAPWQMRQPNQ
jgi:hypothetical protein